MNPTPRVPFPNAAVLLREETGEGSMAVAARRKFSDDATLKRHGNRKGGVRFICATICHAQLA